MERDKNYTKINRRHSNRWLREESLIVNINEGKNILQGASLSETKRSSDATIVKGRRGKWK